MHSVATELKLAASGGNIDFSQAYGNDRRTQSGKFTLAQLRATEGSEGDCKVEFLHEFRHLPPSKWDKPVRLAEGKFWWNLRFFVFE